MIELTKQVGERIRYMRKLRDWTQEQLAERAGLQHSYIGGVERGDRNISLETLEKIIIALDVDPMELFRFEPNTMSAAQKKRRRTMDEHMTLINSRRTDEIGMISKINKDIFSAIDTKND